MRWKTTGDVRAEVPVQTKVRGRVCQVPGCDGKHDSHGYCFKHSVRFRKYGDPNVVMVIPGDYENRFWSRVERLGPDECWPWTGDVSGTYGRFWADGRVIRAHRYAYELLVESIPEGLELDHLCHVRGECVNVEDCPHRLCCNPAHLEPVPAKVNGYRSNSVSADNARKTHCPQNHPYDEANTYFTKRGFRHCRTCARDRARARRHAMEAARVAA